MTNTILSKQYSPTREEILNALGAVSETEYNKMWRSSDEKTKEINELVQKMHILEKKLEIATKALIRIREVYAYNPNQPSYIAQFSNRKAKVSLTEMEKVK